MALAQVGEYRFRMEVVVYDPVSAETLFSAAREKVVWVSLDDEIIFPMINAIKDWHDKSTQVSDPKSLPSPERSI